MLHLSSATHSTTLPLWGHCNSYIIVKGELKAATYTHSNTGESGPIVLPVPKFPRSGCSFYNRDHVRLIHRVLVTYEDNQYSTTDFSFLPLLYFLNIISLLRFFWSPSHFPSESNTFQPKFLSACLHLYSCTMLTVEK